MEIMISRWLQETLKEYEHSKRNQNLYKMNEMGRLARALRDMRENLINSRT